MIHLKTLNKKQLAEFISGGDFKKHDFLPITGHRAKSHIENPKANEDQTLLILAFDDEELAGYVGCFPDYFMVEGQKKTYAWLSTLFISNKFRGKRIAQSLLNRAFEEYDGKIALTEFTREAESLYNKIGLFQYIQPKNGKRYYFQTDFTNIIPAKKPNTQSLKPVFNLADSVANSLISVKNCFIQKPDFRFEILDAVDVESTAFLTRFESHRNSAEINWLIENPWVLEGNIKDESYLFSSYSKQFKYFWIKIYDRNNQLAICSLLLLRDGHLKILYLFSEKSLEKLVDFLSYFVVKNNIITLTSYHPELNQKIQTSKNFPKIHERAIERRYMFHQNLIENLPENFNPKFQDGDGDCAMT